MGGRSASVCITSCDPYRDRGLEGKEKCEVGYDEQFTDETTDRMDSHAYVSRRARDCAYPHSEVWHRSGSGRRNRSPSLADPDGGTTASHRFLRDQMAAAKAWASIDGPGG